jgi:transcriptional regulator with XRE-family HTH domain
MTTLAQKLSLAKPTTDDPIPATALAYVEATARNRMRSFLLRKLSECGVSQKQVAQRLNKDQAQISRALHGAGSMTIDTFASILFAGCGEFAEGASVDLLAAPARNHRGPAWLYDEVTDQQSAPSQNKISTLNPTTFAAAVGSIKFAAKSTSDAAIAIPSNAAVTITAPVKKDPIHA